jgi:hypothetical protein
LTGHALKGTQVPTMADPDPNRPDLLLRVERAQVQSHTLREQVAELADAAVQVELEVALLTAGMVRPVWEILARLQRSA